MASHFDSAITLTNRSSSISIRKTIPRDVPPRRASFATPGQPESHRAFIELNSLPFPLISDTEKRIVRAYGVWMEEPEGGKGDPFRTERTTFVIAPEGRIKTILRKVDPYTHDRLLLEALYA